MIEAVLTVEELPPSMNDIVGQGNRWRYTHTKRHWGNLLRGALDGVALPSMDRVYAMGRLTFPTRTKHDQGNYRFMLEKALGDALQAAGVLADDDWESFSFGDLDYAYEKGVRRTEVYLQCELRREAA